MSCMLRRALSSASSMATAVRTLHRYLKSESAYNPFSGTTISRWRLARRIYNSGYVANQDFGATYVAGRFQQRLFHRIYFGLGAGYENSNYFATDRDVNATRNDDYWFIEPSVDVQLPGG